MNVVFHIGYHKTATSWLQKVYFPQHPELVLLSDSKAPWDDPLLRSLVATSPWKFNQQKSSEILNQNVMLTKANDVSRRMFVVSAERLSGHPVSGGYDSLSIAERIEGIAPQAKIIIVIRKQIDMISAVYKQMVREGYPGRFDTMLHSRKWKSVGFDPAFYEYDILIEKYYTLFGKDNVLTLPYELLRADSGKFVGRLCEFLDVDRVPSPKQNKIINKSVSVSAINIIRRMNYFRRTELNPYPMVVIPDGLRILLTKMILMVSERLSSGNHLITEEQKSWISDYYRESNERLKSIAGIDFSDYANTGSK